MTTRKSTPTTPAAKPTTRTSKRSTSTPTAHPIIGTMARIVAAVRGVTPDTIIAVVRKFNADAPTTGNRNVGRFTGARIMAFQNDSFVGNATWHLDDVQLLAAWCMEFPSAIGRVFAVNGRMGTPDMASVRDGIGIVRGVRADYNRGTHGQNGVVPTPGSVAYGATKFSIVVPAPVAAPVATSTPKSTRVVKPTAKKSAA